MNVNFEIKKQYLLKSRYEQLNEDIVLLRDKQFENSINLESEKRQVTNDFSVHVGIGYSYTEESTDFNLIHVKVIVELSQLDKDEKLADLKLETISLVDISKAKINDVTEFESYIKANINDISEKVMPFTRKITNYLLGKTQIKFTMPTDFKLVTDDEFI